MEELDIGDLGPYLTLLKEKENLQEIQILQQFFDQISKFNESFLDSNSTAPNLLSVSLTNHDTSAAKSLTERLELALLEAKSQLAQQQKLLREIKARQGETDLSSSSKNRLAALGAVRSELNSWVNEKLAASDLDTEQSISTDTTDVGSAPDEMTPEPDNYGQYQDYIKARKRLLRAVAKVNNPHHTKRGSDGIRPTTQISEPSIPKVSMPITPIIREKVLKASDEQKSTTTQRAFLKTLFDGEHAKTGEALGKLRDESHMLPTYPMLARQGRFKNISGKERFGETGEHGTEDEVGARVQAWAFASEAARTARDEHVQTHLSLGKVSLGDAAEHLDDLRAQLGQKSSSLNEPAAAAEDIWTLGIDRDGKQTGGNAQGAWSELNGRVGVS